MEGLTPTSHLRFPARPIGTGDLYDTVLSRGIYSDQGDPRTAGWIYGNPRDADARVPKGIDQLLPECVSSGATDHLDPCTHPDRCRGLVGALAAWICTEAGTPNRLPWFRIPVGCGHQIHNQGSDYQNARFQYERIIAGSSETTKMPPVRPRLAIQLF